MIVDSIEGMFLDPLRLHSLSQRFVALFEEFRIDLERQFELLYPLLFFFFYFGTISEKRPD